MARLIMSLKSLMVAALLLTFWIGGAQELQRHDRYHLHAGDQLKVEFTYTSDLDETVTIQPDGYIVLNTGGAMLIAGKTLEEATALIREKASGRLEDPVVSLTLIDFQKPYFIVSGQVPNPARYDLREPTTALEAVMLAGGITNKGAEKQVIVFHHIEGEDPTIRVLNFKKLRKQTIFEHDTKIVSGDIVYVPRTRLSRIADISTVASTFGMYLSAAAYLAVQ